MQDINSESRVGLRHYSRNLEMAGREYILFGVWYVIRIFMSITMNGERWQEFVSTFDIEGLSSFELKIIYAVVFLIFAAVVIVLHFFIGRSAVGYSRGKKKGKGFIIIGVFMIISLLTGIPGYFVDENGAPVPFDTTILASILVDLTIAFLFFDMIYSTIMIDRCRRRIKEQEAT